MCEKVKQIKFYITATACEYGTSRHKHSSRVITPFSFESNLSLFSKVAREQSSSLLASQISQITVLRIVDFSNAKTCGAVKHCIKAVWEKQNVPVDTDSICKICLDMVGEARDQLESNETMEEIREVFDGSCDLIPLKVVKKECKRLADDFIPELVETLASEMNPQVGRIESFP